MIARAYRGLLADRDPRAPDRFVCLDRDDDGSLLIRARLPAEEGAVIAAALEAGRDAIRAGRAATEEREADGGSVSAETTQIGDSPAERLGEPAEAAPAERGPAAVSNADSLLLMAQTLLASGPVDRAGSDDYQVVVHVDAADLPYDDPDGVGDGLCQLDQGRRCTPRPPVASPATPASSASSSVTGRFREAARPAPSRPA